MQKVLGSIRKVRSTLRQASIREKKGPSLGKIQVKNPHQRSPYAMKFEDQSQEETERQQRFARSKAWNHAAEERKFVVARRVGSPRHATNRRRRTCEGSEPACVQAPLILEWHTQGRKGESTS